jgi:hypothetical protein
MNADAGDPIPIYGRGPDIERLAASRARLTVLSGDSGIGKSEVLRAAQLATAALAPAPRSLPSSGGVIQRVLLDGLAAVLAEDIEQRGELAELGRRLAEAAERVIADGGQELVRVVGKEVLAVVRGRLGAEVGQAVADYVTALKESVDEGLAVRLDNARDQGAAEVVLALASEVIKHLGTKKAVLSLDAGERLAPDDVRILADLAEAMPPGLRIRLAVSTYSARRQAIVDQLREAGPNVAEIPLAGIDQDGVRDWLEAEGLSGDLAPEVTRVTGGYALHLGDLIAHLRDEGEIDDAPISEVFARRTEEAWGQLDQDVARHARRLCVFADPLPFDRTLVFLGLDAAGWGETQDRLRRARIFSVEVNGSPWFHEQRRRYLSEHKLAGDELAKTCSDAVSCLQALAEETQRPDRLAELADLAAQATPLLERNEQLSAVVGLDKAQLAVCAALVELIEPNGTIALDGNALLRHTRQVFEPPGNLIEACRALGATTLVHIVEARGGAAAFPTFADLLVVMAIMGRTQRDLGRTPIPRAASVVFNTQVRPRLVPFGACGYGIGHVRMAQLGENTLQLRRKLSTPVFLGPRNIGPSVLLRGDYAGRAFYTEAAFDTDADRDAALARLIGLETEVFDQEFKVSDVLAHPGDPVPASRFLVAAQRLLRGGIKIDARGASGKRNLVAPMSIADRLSRRASILQFVRERSSLLERYAVELDQPVGFLYFEEGELTEVAEIIGGREDSRLSADAFGRLVSNDPFEIYRIEEMGALAPNERIGMVNTTVSRRPDMSDPAVEMLSELGKRATRFNETQRRLLLHYDETDLQGRLETALNLRLDDARALYESGIFEADAEMPSALSYDVVLAAPSEGTGLFEAGWWNGQVAVRDTDHDRDEVTVRISEEITAEWPTPGNDVITGSRGAAGSIVAKLLGHREEDIRLVQADSV